MPIRQFITYGPYVIPFHCPGENKKIKHIGKDEIKTFWENSNTGNIETKNGCYIFAMQAAKGYMPWYVGQARKSLKSECFTKDKITKYLEVTVRMSKVGTPVMFFVVPPDNKKKVPKTILNDLERFLIHSALNKNPKLIKVIVNELAQDSYKSYGPKYI
jgi:hypothetical protein